MAGGSADWSRLIDAVGRVEKAVAKFDTSSRWLSGAMIFLAMGMVVLMVLQLRGH